MPRAGGIGGAAFWQHHMRACADSSDIRPSCAMNHIDSGRMPAIVDGDRELNASDGECLALA